MRFFHRVTLILALTAGVCLAQEKFMAPATQAEVNAGLNNSKGVTPMTMKNASFTAYIGTNATQKTIQDAINNNGGFNVRFPAFYHFPTPFTNFYITNGIILDLNQAMLDFSLTATGALFSVLSTTLDHRGVVIKDGVLNGGVFGDYSGSGFFSTLNGSLNILYNTHATNRFGIRMECSLGGSISGNTIYGFGGAGMILVNTNNTQSYLSNRFAVYGNFIYSNFCGINLPSFGYDMSGYYNPSLINYPESGPEYETVYGNYINQCQIGVNASAGNLLFLGNEITACYVGDYIFNRAHGNHVGNIINHNVYGAWFESGQGGNFTGNNLLGNTVCIVGNQVQELQIVGNYLGGGAIIVTNGSYGEIKNNYYQGVWGVDFTTNICAGVLLGPNVGNQDTNWVAPTAITFPASDVTWTNNTGGPISLLVDNTGVTGTTLSLNGTAVKASPVPLSATLPMLHGDYFSEHYTVGTPVATFKRSK